MYAIWNKQNKKAVFMNIYYMFILFEINFKKVILFYTIVTIVHDKTIYVFQCY